MNREICNKLYNDSIYNFNSVDKFNLVFTKYILIHINPDKLDIVYEKCIIYLINIY